MQPQLNVTFRSVDAGGMLVDLQTGECFKLNRVGAELWNQLAAGKTVGAAIDSVGPQYDVSHEVLETDAFHLFDQLLRAGLMREGTDEKSGS